MSDLLAPIMVIMENEVDSFWCFSGFMEKIESNFLMEQLEIKLQLSNLRILIEFVDAKFSQYLENNESSNMYFCFRWILILFKREFTFPDIMRLWEVLWTDLPCKNFHLLICVSILLMKKDDIMTNGYGFNEILKVFFTKFSFSIANSFQIFLFCSLSTTCLWGSTWRRHLNLQRVYLFNWAHSRIYRPQYARYSACRFWAQISRRFRTSWVWSRKVWASRIAVLMRQKKIDPSTPHTIHSNFIKCIYIFLFFN